MSQRIDRNPRVPRLSPADVELLGQIDFRAGAVLMSLAASVEVYLEHMPALTKRAIESLPRALARLSKHIPMIEPTLPLFQKHRNPNMRALYLPLSTALKLFKQAHTLGEEAANLFTQEPSPEQNARLTVLRDTLETLNEEVLSITAQIANNQAYLHYRAVKPEAERGDEEMT